MSTGISYLMKKIHTSTMNSDKDIMLFAGHNKTCTPNSDNHMSNYLYVFMLGQFLHGIGGTILYTLGIVFIDTHVKTTESPVYQGLLK